MCLGSRFEDTTQHGEEVWTTDGDRSVHLRPLPMSPRVKKQRAGNAGMYVPGFLLPHPLLFSVSSWSVDWYCLGIVYIQGRCDLLSQLSLLTP